MPPGDSRLTACWTGERDDGKVLFLLRMVQIVVLRI